MPPETYHPACGAGGPLCNPPFALMFPLTTTLNRIKACDPCHESWQAGLQAAGKSKPDDEPISYEEILDAVGIEKALWCCRAEKQHANLWRRYSVWCARQVQHLMTDARSIAALDIAEQHATGLTTDTELAAAEAAAWDAAWPTTGDSWDVAWPTAGAAASASPGFTMAAARGAAEALAWDAAKHVAGPAWDIAWASARGAAWEAQSAAFRQLVTTGTLPGDTSAQSVSSMPQSITITEVCIHPPGDLCNPDALMLGLAPCGDVLVLRQGNNCVELDADDLPLLLEQGLRLLEQG